MNKKEISEIKKTLKPERCTIERIAGCYVNTDKRVMMIPTVSYPGLAEEEAQKYLEIFKKTLSGSIGKTLNTIEFPQEAESVGTVHELLLRLKGDRLQNQDDIHSLFEAIAAGCESDDPYCIILMYAVYDIPVRKNTDVMGDLDGSDNVYSHMILSICPTAMSKASLAYSMKNNVIEDAVRNWLVAAPSFGFLFPAFHDRTSDIHAMLCYTKKQTVNEMSLLQNAFGVNPPSDMEHVKEGYSEIITSVLDENCNLENILYIQGEVNARMQMGDITGNVPVLEKEQLKELLMGCCTDDGSASRFDTLYKETFQDAPLLLGQIAEPKTVIKTDAVTITSSADDADIVKIKEIDGSKCIVIPCGGFVEVNGMKIR